MKDVSAERRHEWHGDEQNGIEFRWYGDFLDEVCMYIDGACVFHLESMSDTSYWMGLCGKSHMAHLGVHAKNNRSHLDMTAEGWPNVSPTPTPPNER